MSLLEKNDITVKKLICGFSFLQEKSTHVFFQHKKNSYF